MALEYGARFHGVFHEMINSMERNRFHYRIWRGVLHESDDPIVVIEFRHAKSQRFGISGIGFTYGEIDPQSRNEVDGDKKRLMMGNEELDEYGNRSFHPAERLDNPVRMILTPGENPDQPFCTRVEFSKAAFNEALQLVEERLTGVTGEYSYLYDEKLIPALRADLIERSSGQFGDLEKPQIVHEESYLENQAQPRAHCKVYFPYGQTFSEFTTTTVALGNSLL